MIRSSFLILLSGIFTLVGLAGCASQQSALTSQDVFSVWNEGIILGEASQPGAPTLGITDYGWLTAWADGQSLFTRQIDAATGVGPAQELLAGSAPWKPALLPAPGQTWQLLWQDRDVFGDMRLWNAHLDANGALLRGPIAISLEGTSGIAAAPGDNGSVVVVWADSKPRPDLYGQVIDAEGRPSGGAPVLIARNAEQPALARTAAGTWILVWLGLPDAARDVSSSRLVLLHRAQSSLPWDVAVEPHQLGLVDLTDATTFVETTQVGLEQDYGYVFVSLRRAADNTSRTDMWTFPLDPSAMSPPSESTTIYLPETAPETTAAMQTEFNTGPVYFITEDSSAAVAWPIPARGQYAILPVAFTVNGQVVVAYFQDGVVTGYQPIGAAERAIGAVGLWIGRERYLTISWIAEPSSNGDAAHLMLSTTRPLSLAVITK